MKTSSMITIAAALVGFGSGWLLKPSGNQGGADAGTTPPPRPQRDHGQLVAPGEQQSARINARIAALTKPTEPGTPGLEPVNVGKSYATIKERRDNAKLLRLSEALGLSEDQEEAIAALLKKRSQEFNPYNGDLTKRGDALEQAANAEGSFEESLRAILDEDQLARLDAYKTRETDNRVEVQTQQKLSKLMSSVDLSEEQRQLASEIYRQASRERVASDPAGWQLIENSNSLVGGSPVLERYRDLFSDPAVANDPKAFQERLAQEQQEEIQEEILQIEDLLTPAQLEEFRASLESVSPLNNRVIPPTTRDPRFRRDS